MAESEYTYICLRCHNEYKEMYDPSKGPKEITCPECRSNSVRRLPLKKEDEKK
ncbi:hypothetical protein KKB99_03710 [bacterium]|nr:hypothetical protein [bacterium]MBU1025098.1 hypothetical protein [bacterium]